MSLFTFLMVCVTLDEFIQLPEPQFSHKYSRD